MYPDYCFEFVETVFDEADGAPTPSEALNSPPRKRNADAHDRRQDDELAAVLSKAEIKVLNYHQSSGLSRRRGQALLDMLRHLDSRV